MLKMSSASTAVYVAFVLLVHQTLLQQACIELTFQHFEEEDLSVVENQFVNVTFWMNVSTCKESNTSHRITVNTRTKSGSVEYDGTITYWRVTCSNRSVKSVRCISPTGPAALSRTVNRSHVQIEWKLISTPSGDSTIIPKNLTVLFVPKVTSLTVNRREVLHHYVINESEEFDICCSFDEGNPPTSFILFDKYGKEIDALRGEQHLNHSSSAQCQEDWPIIRCEGSGSTKNRSVTVLVRCSPQFIDKSPNVSLGIYEQWVFNIKAYTTVVDKCLLTSLSAGENSRKEVNCTLTGDPPNLKLTVVLLNDSITGANWSLNISFEGGFSETLVLTLPSVTEKSLSSSEETLGPEFFVGIFLLGVIVLTATIAFVVVALKRMRKPADNRGIRAADESRFSTENVRGSFSRNSSTDENNYTSVLEVQDKRRRQKQDLKTDVAQVTNAGALAEIMESSTVSRRSDGLVYGDLDFTNTRVSDKVTGTMSETEYAALNFTAIVPPPRDYKQKPNKKEIEENYF